MRAHLVFLFAFSVASLTFGQDSPRIWLTHRTNRPSHVTINWETPEVETGQVRFGDSADCEHRAEDKTPGHLHHVDVPLPESGALHYRVSSAGRQSDVYRVRAYPEDELKIAVVADWQSKPNLDALLQERVHLLLSAGDHVNGLHSSGVNDAKANTKPFSDLIGAYPELFRTTPFLPALGNHDREIRPRGPKPPPEAVYDVEATAFRAFFPLPDEGWKWRFEIPEFELRILALDLNHISDQGTTWQTCHPLGKDSEQFRWYDEQSARKDRQFLLTLYNEQNGQMRSQAGGQWGRMIQRGTAAISGFGYFAERAEVDPFPYFNTALGTGAAYRDRQAKFFEVTPSYLLLTFRKGSNKMRAQLKNLSGKVLDESLWRGNAE
jgi:hypothetical protein